MSISDHIVASGLSRAEICKRAQLSPAMLSMIETGNRKPSPRSARALAETLGVAPEDIRPDLAALFSKPSPAPGDAA